MIPASSQNWHMAERRILTVHCPQRGQVVDEVLTAVETALLDAGASHVWIDPSSEQDMTVMAELPVAEGETVAVPAPRSGQVFSAGS